MEQTVTRHIGGIPIEEYQARAARAQARMAAAGIDALLLTTEADVRYVSGFLTRFWESPTRPWFLVLPCNGAPVAVIPEIGAPLMTRGWIEDVRTWPAPRPADDGVSLLARTLRDCAGPRGRIGTPMGHETHLRMPLADWDRLRGLCPGMTFGDDGAILRDLRSVKSKAEIGKIRAACAVADRAFARMAEIAAPDVPLDRVFRGFQMLALEEGADHAPYLAGASGQGGYADVISPADGAPLAVGEVLMLDAGIWRAGYFSDFNRNFAIGRVEPAMDAAHERLIEATAAGFAAARPGATVAALHHAMAGVLGESVGAGRLGHGLGMQLTEWPSILPDVDVLLAPGMVLTLEPSINLGDGRLMVHEEVMVVTETGADWLSSPWSAALSRIG